MVTMHKLTVHGGKNVTPCNNNMLNHAINCVVFISSFEKLEMLGGECAVLLGSKSVSPCV